MPGPPQLNMEMLLDQASLFHYPEDAVPWDVTPLPDVWFPGRLQVYFSAPVLNDSDNRVKHLLIERSIDPQIMLGEAYARLRLVLPPSLMPHIKVEKTHADGRMEGYWAVEGYRAAAQSTGPLPVGRVEGTGPTGTFLEAVARLASDTS